MFTINYAEFYTVRKIATHGNIGEIAEFVILRDRADMPQKTETLGDGGMEPRTGRGGGWRRLGMSSSVSFTVPFLAALFIVIAGIGRALGYMWGSCTDQH